jgi:mycofactocin precursor
MTVTTENDLITAVDSPPAPAGVHAPAPADPSGADLVEEDLLVEDVSIDGMCGVY